MGIDFNTILGYGFIIKRDDTLPEKLREIMNTDVYALEPMYPKLWFEYQEEEIFVCCERNFNVASRGVLSLKLEGDWMKELRAEEETLKQFQEDFGLNIPMGYYMFQTISY